MLDENYYQVSGFMINRLGLKGAELHIYAIIYGFTQDGESEFTGSINYLCEWLSSSRPTVSKALASLVEKKLIEKRVEVINKVSFNRYKINLQVVKNLNGGSKEILQGVVKNFYGGSKEILHNNNIDNNRLDNKEDNKEKKKGIDYLAIVNAYKETCVSLPAIRSLSEARKKAIRARLNSGYTQDDFITLFKKAQESDFLKGKNSRNWNADFDWLIKDANMAKVLEGKYDNKGDVNNGSDQSDNGSAGGENWSELRLGTWL